MSVSFPEGFVLKEFKATNCVTGTTIMRISRNAKRLLEYLMEQLPFDLISIQMDGGSQFRDKFERACEALNISLFVLPPRKPKWNGCVERAKGTTRYEFYPVYEGALTIASVNQKLEQYPYD
ncbi:MAG: hypothetical protein A6F72_03080 [Cycloclasticus sp. symbiont of Poecilosclerida sp. N]|nr:MAG: hypothetical protein A6F72_03080 [Cycloclasticus sp. symbiont of Poecilosclerida sp. N]